MRLINADALLDGYKHMGYDPTDYPEDSHMEGWCKGFNAAVDHCMHHVIHAPTITPERKRGRWILQDTSYWRPTPAGDAQVNRVNLKCSCCGHRLVKAQKVKNYCPNCGAEMMGDRKNE